MVPDPVNDPSFTVTPVSVTLPVFVTTKEYVITRPTVNDAISDGFADFTIAIAGAGVIVTFALDGDDVTAVPEGGVPVAVAVLVIVPALTSACVLVYAAVQVTDAPGANDAAPDGHDTGDSAPVPENAPSATDTLVRVTFPVFVTTNEYITASPAADTVEGVADFCTEIAGSAAAVTAAVDGPETTSPPAGDVADAVAVFMNWPASTSACVASYVAEQVTDAPGSNDAVTGQLTADIDPEPVNEPSVTVGLVSVTFPVLVTKKEYVTV